MARSLDASNAGTMRHPGRFASRFPIAWCNEETALTMAVRRCRLEEHLQTCERRSAISQSSISK